MEINAGAKHKSDDNVVEIGAIVNFFKTTEFSRPQIN